MPEPRSFLPLTRGWWSEEEALLYNFVQFVCHRSHPISEDPCNNFFSIYRIFFRNLFFVKMSHGLRVDRNCTVCTQHAVEQMRKGTSRQVFLRIVHIICGSDIAHWVFTRSQR